MRAVVERVMQTFGMMHSLTDKQIEETREVLLNFLATQPADDEHKATVASLTYLNQLRT
jgi:hypothetical protein